VTAGRVVVSLSLVVAAVWFFWEAEEGINGHGSIVWIVVSAGLLIWLLLAFPDGPPSVPGAGGSRPPSGWS
jgi:hypothetical protein